MKHLLIHLDDKEYRELSEVKDEKGLTWKGLLLSVCLNMSKQKNTTTIDGRSNVEPISEGGPQASFASSSFKPVAADAFQQRSPGGSSLRAGPPPKENCRRCGGKPVYDNVLGEWTCGSCGSVLRLQKS